MPIDRKSLVSRHNVRLNRVDVMAPLQVGNGEFAFTADVTGMQTFHEHYLAGLPLFTMAQWADHSFPNTGGYAIDQCTKLYPFHGRMVPYASQAGLSRGSAATDASKYLRANPHRISLSRIGLRFRNGLKLADISEIDQTLDLWTGRIISKFKLAGAAVQIITAAHPSLDGVAFTLESKLIDSGDLGIEIAFPAGSEDWRLPADWSNPESHRTQTTGRPNGVDFARSQDESRQFARALWDAGAQFERAGEHQYFLHGTRALSMFFAPQPINHENSAAQTIKASEKHWPNFWSTGGAIDLSEAKDPRAPELERRIVLSQYLTAVNCASSGPPQETGHLMNSWFGKAHLEMHFWHAAHFASWNRIELLERSLGWYEKIMPLAIANAQKQGFEGARWPKMVGMDGVDSPSDVAVFLIWQQPHPIYFAELVYRAKPTRETLLRFEKIIEQTAIFMASYAHFDGNRYVLGPAMIPAQESYGGRDRTINPPYELVQWWWALSVAQKWNERLGKPREAKWDHVIANISKPVPRDGVYTGIEVEPYTITKDHPSMLQAFGNMPPSPLIDPKIMSATLDHVLKVWDWPSTWGWDYPVLAMCAARLGRPEIAVDALLMNVQKNKYLPNGHNYQTERLPVYLPGNGGLLLATAMMAGGWDGADPNVPAPGFPRDWNVNAERLRPLP